VAIEKGIPSIVFPQMQAIEQTGVFGYSDKVRGNWWAKTQFDFCSTPIDNLIDTSSDFIMADIDQYIYPSDELISRYGVKIHYLSNYISWDPFAYWGMAIDDGFIPVDNVRTFESHYRSGCTVYYQIHDLMRFHKYGYIKARDHFNREIRFGRISKINALNRYSDYLGKSFDNSGFYDAMSIGDSGRRWYESNILSDVYNKLELTLKNLESGKTCSDGMELFKYSDGKYKSAGEQVIFSKSLYV
jgi:hypothetical protein